MNKKLEVLCVDDEPQVLEGLKLHLKQRYVVHVASSGTEGLGLLRDNKNVSVILSDMRMPVMDGAKFLNAARTAAPDSVRMLLTGYTDMQSAMAAVNEGQIFRFISKPCPPDQLHAAFLAAVTQHRLIVAEKVLLQETLLGCVESLTKVLSLTKPSAFGRGLRLRNKVRAILQHLAWDEQWQLEAAAVLSQLGAVTLSEDVLARLNEGEGADESDREEYAASLDTSVQMLEAIPRLEPVIDILKYVSSSIRGKLGMDPNKSPAGGKMLRIILDWDALEARGLGQAEALAKLSEEPATCDRELVEKLKILPALGGAQSSVVNIKVRDLKPGMVLSQDLVRKNGVVILPRGFEIDRGLLAHIHAFAGGELQESSVSVSMALG